MGLPVEVNNLMMGSLGGYNINRSLRLRSSASAYLNRTPASASNRKTWTWSAWVKRGALSANQVLFSTSPSSQSDTTTFEIQFLNDKIYIQNATTQLRYTTAVYRDPSAWYHILSL
jgi:hypothetical protein